MIADSMLVEGKEYVDGGSGSFLRVCLFASVERGSEFGCKGESKERGDLIGRPVFGHAIREASGVIDNEDVGFIAKAELEGAFLKLFFAGFAETVGIACIRRIFISF
jgi:hypothetical protein